MKFCKAIILQLKINNFFKKKRKNKQTKNPSNFRKLTDMFKRSKNKPDIANLKINDTEEKQLVLTEVSTEEKDRKKHT